ncbi:MAG TPA: exo-beta-N-acetylmuramidase NamZ domain-containing protein [Verrucomicrobiae bacterium]
MALNGAALMLVLALAFTGCQSKSASQGGNQTTATATAKTGTNSPAPQATESKVVKGLRTPTVLNVKPTAVFKAEKLAAMDAAITNAIGEGKLPGGVLWLERGQEVYLRGYGWRAVEPKREVITTDTIYDAASLTKVVATTPAILILLDRGLLQLNDPVKRFIPEFTGGGKENVTVRHLMTHVSGLRSGLGATPAWTGYDTAIKRACGETLQTEPGAKFLYSDINFILLGEIVRRASGMPLNQFVEENIYKPLKMVDTGYLPSPDKLSRIAPTESIEGKPLRGVVHDPTSRKMGGVAGHAGLFTTANDLARYARMILNGGSLDGARVLKTTTVQMMENVHTPSAVADRRGLGWDIDSSYAGPRGNVFPIGSFGHTGWTGTCLWIDPFSQTFYIFVSNRNHPTEKGSVTALRRVLGTLAAEAVNGFDFNKVPGALPPRMTNKVSQIELLEYAAADGGAPLTPTLSPPRGEGEKTGAAERKGPQVLNGIDVLKREKFARLKGLRLGLITNHTGQDKDRNPIIDMLHEAEGIQLKALFGPEHGIRGLLDEKVPDSKDEKTGLPVYSLYGETRVPKPEHLKDLDALIFDIQDIGCRFYTYPSTMGNCMEAAAKAKIKYFVLDRVNPITGTAIDGPVLTDKTSFVAYHQVPVRHGMTIGELAKMYNAEKKFGADLTVIEIEGWKRGMWFDETGQPWKNPSPNMRSLTQATLYPGVGLLEFSAVSVGRGTDTPFEVVGAPYIDDLKLAAELNAAGLKHVRFVPIRFTPNASVNKDKECRGVNIILTDREKCEVVDIGILIASTLHRMYPNDYDLNKFKKLLGHDATIEMIREGKSVKEIRKSWEPAVKEFMKRRKEFLIY